MLNKLTFSALNLSWNIQQNTVGTEGASTLTLLLAADGWMLLCVLRSRLEHFHLVERVVRQ